MERTEIRLVFRIKLFLNKKNRGPLFSLTRCQAPASDRVDDDTCATSPSNLFLSTLETNPFAWILRSGQSRRELCSSL